MDNMGIVHVVDDDESVRASLSRLLRTAGYETRCYASAGEFLLSPHGAAPGCLVLDVSMPGPSGLDLQEALAAAKRTIPIVFLTGYGDIPMGVRAMKGGAVDFLTKPVQSALLLEAVAAALSRDRDRQAEESAKRALLERFGRLTSRERQVFFQVTDGRLNKQIATDLGISERTIKAHRAQIMDKMAVRTLADLVRAADRIGAAQDRIGS